MHSRWVISHLQTLLPPFSPQIRGDAILVGPRRKHISPTIITPLPFPNQTTLKTKILPIFASHLSILLQITPTKWPLWELYCESDMLLNDENGENFIMINLLHYFVCIRRCLYSVGCSQKLLNFCFLTSFFSSLMSICSELLHCLIILILNWKENPADILICYIIGSRIIFLNIFFLDRKIEGTKIQYGEQVFH